MCDVLYWIFGIFKGMRVEKRPCAKILMVNHNTIHHTPCIIHHASYTMHHTSHMFLYTSHITHHASHITHLTSHITHQTSNITYHTSHITHHTSNTMIEDGYEYTAPVKSMGMLCTMYGI